MSLHNIQHCFIDQLTAKTPKLPLADLFQPTITLSVDEQQSVYLKNANGVHAATLTKIYPAIHHTLGEDYFQQLCRDYRRQFPSHDPDLNNYGEQFSHYLQQQINNRSELSDFYYLAELATLEWHWHRLFYCSQQKSFDLDAFSELDEACYSLLQFTLSHGLFVSKTKLPVIEIWQANRFSPAETQTFSLLDKNSYFAISSIEQQPQLVLITAADYDLYQMIKQKKDFLNITHDFPHPTCPLPDFISRQWIDGYYLLE